MEWDDFKYFLAVARSGSLTGAARALRTSAATVGRRIMALEARLGARLFDRGQTGYALTDSGEAIRLKAEEIEEAVLSLEGKPSDAICGRPVKCAWRPRKILPASSLRPGSLNFAHASGIYGGGVELDVPANLTGRGRRRIRTAAN